MIGVSGNMFWVAIRSLWMGHSQSPTNSRTEQLFHGKASGCCDGNRFSSDNSRRHYNRRCRTYRPRPYHNAPQERPARRDPREGGRRVEIDLRSCFDATKAHCVRWRGAMVHGDEKNVGLRFSGCFSMLEWPITEVNLRISP